MPEQIKDILAPLGLNERETKVYLACLELGGASIQELSEKAGVKRTSIYNFLEELKTKGLLTEIKKNHKTLLIPEDPHSLIENRKNQIKEIGEQIGDIENIIPDLMAIYNAPGHKAKIKYYQGIDGLKKLYNDTLIPNSTLYGFIDADKAIKTMGDFIWEYLDNRVKIGMDYKVIGKPGKWEEDPHIDHEAQKRSVKYVKPQTRFDTEIDIYSNKVSIYSFKPPYAGIIIEDIAIHNTLKSIWKLLWDNLPEK